MSNINTELINNVYHTFLTKSDLHSKTEDELIDIYKKIKNFKNISDVVFINKTKDNIILLILNHLDNLYIKTCKKQYNKHTDEGEKICKSYTVGILNDGTKEVKDRIHSIHDFIRNKGFGYGMTGLKLFNLFYGLLQIEKANVLLNHTFSNKTLLNTKLTNDELKKKLSFHEIYKYIDSYTYADDMGTTDKAAIISNTITNLCELLRKFDRGEDSKIKNLIYYDLSHIKANANDIKQLLTLIKQLDELSTSKNIQLGGKIYEYFIGRDQSAISDLGAYFTDRHLVNYIFDTMLDINNTVDIDNLPKVCDMFGGSGGFTITFIVYINNILKTKNMSDTDIYNYWEKYINNIYHYDVNQDVVNNAKLEAFCLTHQLISKANFTTHNSFKHDFKEDKYDLIISNPPYGGDKASETAKMKEYNSILEYNNKLLYSNSTLDINEEQRKNILIQNLLLKTEINYLKDEQRKNFITYNYCKDNAEFKQYFDNIIYYENNFRKRYNADPSNKIKKGYLKSETAFNDKESCSFVLLMYLCAKGGTVIGVLKEGVFFDSKYSHIRRYLLSHFIVKRIDSNPSDTFENTTTKTSNILFHLPSDGFIPDNYTIDFYDVEVIKNTEDKLNYVNNVTYIENANNDTIKEVNAVNKKTVSIKEILTHFDCSFNSKQYNKVELEPGDGFKLVSYLNDSVYDKKSIHKASVAKQEGKYPFYTSSTHIKYSEYCDYKDLSIIIGTGGNGSLHLGKNFSCSTDNFVIKFNNDLLTQYKYYILKCNWNYLISLMNGSTIKHITKSIIQSLELPIPETEEQINYWVNYISEPYNKKQEELYNSRLEELRNAAIKT